MNRLIVKGVDGLDGTYEFEEFENFTNRELRRIKLLTGLRVGEFEDAFRAGDNDMIVGLATVILERMGKEVDSDLLWDAEAGQLIIEFAAAKDPTQASPTTTERSFDERKPSESVPSGASSEPSSETPETSPSLTGALDLQSSAT